MASGGSRRRKARRGGGEGAKVKKKKTKYLSLSRHLNLIKAEDLGAVRSPELVEVVVKEETPPPSPGLVPKEETPSSPEEDAGDRGEQQQMETFALFAAAPSLTDILGASASSAGGDSSSPGVSGGTELAGEEDDLARRALRGRERWVYCSSSSSPSAATTTTSSSSSSAASTGASSDGGGGGMARSLLLKLDYEEILAAWAGRGSLYIGGATAAAGEDNGAVKLELDSVFVDVGPSPEQAAAATWSVAGTAARAEKVRRYKEKRNVRLFAKRIRYEVRRLNAVKRPRVKGRFIKEKEDAPMKSRRQLQLT